MCRLAKPNSKGHNSIKILSIVSKFELDLYLKALNPFVNFE